MSKKTEEMRKRKIGYVVVGKVSEPKVKKLRSVKLRGEERLFEMERTASP